MFLISLPSPALLEDELPALFSGSHVPILSSILSCPPVHMYNLPRSLSFLTKNRPSNSVVNYWNRLDLLENIWHLGHANCPYLPAKRSRYLKRPLLRSPRLSPNLSANFKECLSQARWEEVFLTSSGKGEGHHSIFRNKINNNYSMSPSWIWSDKITKGRVARLGYNHFISNKGEWNNCFSKFSNRVLPPIFMSAIVEGWSWKLRAENF